MATSGAMWTQHFVDMARGLIPYQKRLYKVTVQTGNGDVQMVTPTQAVVERAKLDLKRKLAEAATVQKPKRIRVLSVVPEVERERAQKRNLQERNLLKC